MTSPIRTLARAIAMSTALCCPLPAFAMSLQEAVRLSAERDAMVNALQQAVARETTNIEAAKDARRPQFRISGDTGDEDTDELGINLTITQVLFDWGRVKSLIAAASFERVKVAAELKLEIELLTLEIAEIYLDVETTRKKIAATQTYMDFAQRLQGFARDRVAAGVTDSSEVARARLEIARAEERMAQLQSDLDIARSLLEFQTGRMVEQIDTPPVISYTEEYSSSANLIAAVAIAPEYLQARADVDIAQANITRARAETRPTINLQARGRQELTGGRGRGGSIGLSAGVDLNAGSFAGRAIIAAQQDLAAAQFRLNGVERDLQNTSRQFIQQIGALGATRQALDAQLRNADDVLAAYEQQFVAGRRDLLDLLTTGRDKYEAEILQIETEDTIKRIEYSAAQAVGVLGSLLLRASR